MLADALPTATSLYLGKYWHFIARGARRCCCWRVALDFISATVRQKPMHRRCARECAAVLVRSAYVTLGGASERVTHMPRRVRVVFPMYRNANSNGSESERVELR